MGSNGDIVGIFTNDRYILMDIMVYYIVVWYIPLLVVIFHSSIYGILDLNGHINGDKWYNGL